jgi:hypothetical protein
LVDFDHDTILVEGFEAVRFYRDVVRARQQCWDAILALLVGGDSAGCRGVRALHNHSCAGNREAGGIGDEAGEFGVLREQRRCGQQSRNNERKPMGWPHASAYAQRQTKDCRCIHDFLHLMEICRFTDLPIDPVSYRI